MPSGRPPKPIELKRLTGRGPNRDSGGRPIPEPVEPAAIAVRDSLPVPADELGERGLAEWRKIWQAGYWLRADQDYPWVLMIAHAYDDIETFRRKVKRDGLVQKGSMGQVVAHPLIGEIRKAEAVIMKALSTLGFSPTDRARLGLAEIKARSALEDMIAKAGQSR